MLPKHELSSPHSDCHSCTLLLNFFSTMSNDIIEYIRDVDDFSVSDARVCAPEQTKLFMGNPSACYTILTQNIRSINCNFLNLETLVHRIDFDSDFLVLTECWLSCTSNCRIPALPNYTMYSTTNHINHSDGVVVYAKSSLLASCEEPDLLGAASGLLIKLETDIAVLCIYRSPSNDNIRTFLTALNTVLPALANFNSVIITGDINVDIKPDTLDTRSHEYLSTLAYHGFLPAHTLATRGNNCLDHVIIRTKAKTMTLVYNTTVTDHCSTLFSLNNNKLKHIAQKTYSKIDYEALDTYMEKLDFNPLYLVSDPNIAIDNLISIIKPAINECTKTAKISARKRILKPWITPGLLRCIRNRDSLHKKVKQTPGNLTLLITYKRYRNFCTSLLKKVKRQYDSNELNKASQNPKKLWDTIKTITNTHSTRINSNPLLNYSTSPTQSCNEINEFFANIGKKLADNLNVVHSSLSPPNPIYCTNSFVMLHTDVEEIHATINKLRTNAASGWDGISSYFLKRYAKILAPVLCHIFNTCFLTSIFPTSLKRAVIHPIFKGGDRNLPNNYRPIAVLSALSKVLERIVNKQIIHYLERFKLLSPNQFGFRKNKSTSDAVHSLINNVTENLNNNKKVLTVFLDLAKAFDTVPVSTLLIKLESIGVRGSPLEFFRSYLSDRSQSVVIDNHKSEELPIQYGVPQGSILGPTLFLVYINSLCNLNVTNAKIVSYADDTAITFSANTWTELQTVAQDGFNTITKWLLSHTLTLNATKTNFVIFSISNTTQSSISISLKAHSCSIQNQCQCPDLNSVEKIKYLGILLDKNLNFKTHISTLTNRIRKLIYIFKTLRHVANPAIIRNVYFALCQSVLTYCISCWGGAAKTTLKPLEIAHRAILKVATFRPIRFPTTELYKACNLLNVRQQFILHTILLQHLKTPYLKISKRRKNNICSVPSVRKKFIKKFFPYLGPSLYNKMNEKQTIYGSTIFNCKKTVRLFLSTLNYEETEDFLR